MNFWGFLSFLGLVFFVEGGSCGLDSVADLLGDKVANDEEDYGQVCDQPVDYHCLADYYYQVMTYIIDYHSMNGSGFVGESLVI